MKTQYLGSTTIRGSTLAVAVTVVARAILALAVILTLAATSTRAQSDTTPTRPSTNTTELMDVYAPLAQVLAQHSDREPSFLEDYQISLAGRSDKFFDKFEGPSTIRWIRAIDLNGYKEIEHFNTVGAETFGQAAIDSFLDIAVDHTPIDEWRENSQTWFKKIFFVLLHGSFGNSREEAVDLTSPSASAIEEKMFRDAARSPKAYEYGFKAFRPDPYLYANLFWSKRNGDLRGILHLRYRLTPVDTENPSGRFEARVTLPIFRVYRVSIGGSIKPVHLNGENGKVAALRIERTLPETLPWLGFVKKPVIVFAGARCSNNDPWLVEVGAYAVTF